MKHPVSSVLRCSVTNHGTTRYRTEVRGLETLSFITLTITHFQTEFGYLVSLSFSSPLSWDLDHA